MTLTLQPPARHLLRAKDLIDVRYRDPLDVPATLGTEETVKAVAREFADSARKRLKDLTGVQD